MDNIIQRAFIDNEQVNLLQDKIKIYSCSFHLAAYSPRAFEAFAIDLPHAVLNAVPKRQAEFLAGRYLMQQALKDLGHSACQVPIGQHRQPVLPDGILASISHTDQHAYCGIKRGDSQSYLGIDAEHWLATAVAEDIQSTIITPMERSYLRTLDRPFHILLTLVFSAKESLFKAIYKFVGAYFDFDCAAISGIDFNQKSFTLTLQTTLAASMKQGTEFKGSFTSNDQLIVTLITDNECHR